MNEELKKLLIEAFQNCDECGKEIQFASLIINAKKGTITVFKECDCKQESPSPFFEETNE